MRLYVIWAFEQLIESGIKAHFSFFARWHIGGAPTNQHKTGSRPPQIETNRVNRVNTVKINSWSLTFNCIWKVRLTLRSRTKWENLVAKVPGNHWIEFTLHDDHCRRKCVTCTILGNTPVNSLIMYDHVPNYKVSVVIFQLDIWNDVGSILRPTDSRHWVAFCSACQIQHGTGQDSGIPC